MADPMTTPALEPCPGCARTDELYTVVQTTIVVIVQVPHSPVRVMCRCGWAGPEYWTQADAIAAWNRRATHPVPAAPPTKEKPPVALNPECGRDCDDDYVRVGCPVHCPIEPARTTNGGTDHE